MNKKTPSLITLPFKLEREAPPFETYDEQYSDKYPESLVRYFLEKYTKKGDYVFDPFAGLGTTLFVSEETGRIPYGMEADQNRAEWVAGQLENWTGLRHGDTAKMLHHDFPKMDFVMTSPPFMHKHMKANPLYGGDPKKSGYNNYIKRMRYIFEQLSKLVKRNGYIIVHLDNLEHKQSFTPLVWDIGSAISTVMKPEKEIIVVWKNGRDDYPHTHCLLFKNTGIRTE